MTSSLRKLLELSADDSSYLRAAPILRWGIAGPGRIADNFVRALASHTDQRVTAVGSRSSERAARFGRTHRIDVTHDSYDKLITDPGIDIVYVAVPNAAHLDIAILAIEAGKHVLIEKPIGVNAAQAREIQIRARTAGVFAMEGMWSRFLPQFEVMEWVQTKCGLGEIRMVSADFGERFTAEEEPSVFDPVLAGGALRDLGVYPAWFAQFVLGEPTSVAASGSLTDTGVDAQSAITLTYPDGALAALSTSLLVSTPGIAAIAGTRATAVFDSPFLMPGGFTITEGSERFVWRDRSGISGLGGLAWEAAHAARCIAEGRLESAKHSLHDSIAVSSVLDESRHQLGSP